MRERVQHVHNKTESLKYASSFLGLCPHTATMPEGYNKQDQDSVLYVVFCYANKNAFDWCGLLIRMRSWSLIPGEVFFKGIVLASS